MSPSNRPAWLRTAALRALIIALLTVAAGEPAHAQGSLLRKLRETSKVIKEKTEQADTALTNMEATAQAVQCLANEEDCAEQQEVAVCPEVVTDSSAAPFAQPSDTVNAQGQCGRGPRAPPDSSEASRPQSLSKS